MITVDSADNHESTVGMVLDLGNDTRAHIYSGQVVDGNSTDNGNCQHY